MKNRVTRFLISSLLLVSLFCVCVFSVQTVWSSRIGADAITDIGVIYMSGISEQVASHFRTTMELRLNQVEGLVYAVPPEQDRDLSAIRMSLAYIAKAQGFEYLAFYTQDDQLDMVYGPQLALQAETFPQSLHHETTQVGLGRDVNGNPVVMVAVPAGYPLENGKESIALIAALPVKYLDRTLTENIYESMADYAIIQLDGSMIIRSKNMRDSTNYFHRAATLYKPLDGRSGEQLVSEMTSAMDQNQEYTCQVQMDDVRWHIYCSPLPDSGWYLILYMPYSTLDQTISTLGNRWTFVSVGGCCLILSVLLLVFLKYFQMTQQQVRELNEARKSAERASQVKSEFLSNMSHDIRTPMNGIMGMTAVAIANLGNTPQVRSCLKKINLSSRHLLSLLNDILDMSKIERGELHINLEPVSLREIICNMLPMIHSQIEIKHQDFRVYTRNIYCENVLSDTVRLTQILLNLLGNAAKFTPEGGKIQLHIYQEDSPKGAEFVRTHLTVSDNGIGMDEKLQERIFDAFVRKDNARVQKASGSGLGLTITKHVIDAMQGTIDVTSQLGKGSEFHVVLDLEKTHVQELDQHLPERNVLVVDSDPQTRETALEMLSSIGLRAEGAQDAGQGIDAVKNADRAFHIILLHWNLPHEEGIQAVKQLREQLQLPVLTLCSGDWSDIEEWAGEAGIAGCVTEPIFRSSLYYGLRKFVQTIPQEIEVQPPVMDFSGRRVLLAEDNELNYEIANELLQEMGLEVDWAENGQICVEKFQESPPAWYDIVLMDLRMPQMTGFEAARAIRSLDRNDAESIPIIAVSADAFYDDVQHCLECGMNDHTAKPIDISEVSRLINKYIQR